MKNRTLINARTVFIATLVVMPTLILIVYFSGISQHRSLYLNSLFSTTIVSIVFFVFITSGLYNGWKLKDTLGKFNLRRKIPRPPDTGGFDAGGFDLADAGAEGIGGILVAIFLWICIAVIGSMVLFYAGTIIWLTIVSIAAILYWIIFRAFRLIFKNSTECSGNITKSILIAVLYTLLYNFWIYGIIFGVHFLNS